MYGAPGRITAHLPVGCPSGHSHQTRMFKIAPGNFVEPYDEPFLTKQHT
jgi:hypothetical protein